MSATYTVNGITIDSDFPLLRAVPASGRADLELRRADRPVIVSEAGLTPLYTGKRKLPNGEPLCTVYRHPEGDVVRIGTARLEFVISGNVIRYCIIDPQSEDSLEIIFGNIVLSLWAERSGHLALHASAVVVDGVCVAFSASSQAGKSSLAAGFIQAGCDFVTDDILGVTERDGVFVAQPGAPHMRMWPDLVSRFVGPAEQFPRVLPGTVKRIVTVGASGWGNAAVDAVPIAVLYLPQREPDRRTVALRALPPAEALVAVSRASFVAAMGAVFAGQQAARLALLSRLVRQVAVCELRYPSGYEHLHMVREAVQAHVAVLPGQPIAAL